MAYQLAEVKSYRYRHQGSSAYPAGLGGRTNTRIVESW